MHLLSRKIDLYRLLSVYPTTRLLRVGQSIIAQAGRKEDAIKRYPKFEGEIEYFASNDPSGNLKYLDWELKILKNGQALAPEINDVVQLFHKLQQHLPKRDINQYGPQDFTSLRDQLFKIRDEKEKQKEEREGKVEKRYRTEEKCDAPIIYEDDRFVVRQIKNKAASVHYGLGTRWCITMKEAAYFEDYDMNNVVFFFIIRKFEDDPEYNNLGKIAVSIQRDSTNNLIEWKYWQANDKTIDSFMVFNYLGPKHKAIVSSIENAANNTPKSLMAKMVDGEATPEEMDKIFEFAQKQEDERNKIQIFERITAAQNLSQETYKKVFDASRNSTYSYTTSIQLAMNKSVGPALLDEILASDDIAWYEKQKYKKICEWIASNPNTSPETLRTLFNKQEANSEDIKLNVLRNKNVPSELLLEVAQNSKVDSRELAAAVQNPNISPEILSQLAKDKTQNIIRFIAKNINTPANILKEIYEYTQQPPEQGQDQGWLDSIKFALTVNRKLPIDILQGLAKDPDPRIRANVVQNSNTPKELAAELRKDPVVQYQLEP